MRNYLWMAGDDQPLADALTERTSPELLAERICSTRRMELPESPIVH
jgi:hypothetical protein